jgi:hypothetical protein
MSSRFGNRCIMLYLFFWPCGCEEKRMRCVCRQDSY